MGGACSAQSPESIDSKAIDEGLKKDWEILSNEVRLLLLGAARIQGLDRILMQ